MKLLNFFKGWSFDRYFRLGMAILAGVYAISSKEYPILIVTVWLGSQAIFNLSCCGVGGCNTSPSEKQKELEDNNVNVKYEEIK